MRNMKIVRTGVLILLAGLAMTASAQVGPAGPGGGFGGGFGNGGGGRQQGPGQQQPPMDPQQIQQMVQQRNQQQMDAIKAQMQASDDDFAVIQPKIQDVIDKEQAIQMASITRQLRTINRMINQAGGNANVNINPNAILNALNRGQPPSAIQQTLTELQVTLDNTDSTPEAIASKLEAYRIARARATQELVTAQSDLLSLLTQRQEAVMVVAGLLN